MKGHTLIRAANEFLSVCPHPFSITVNFGTRDLVIILLSIWDFRENSPSECCTFLMFVNEITFTCVP